MFIENPGRVAGLLARRKGIERTAQFLERGRDLFGGALFCPFEHQVLNEMGSTVFLSRLVA
jgi:hypothetical protein